MPGPLLPEDLDVGCIPFKQRKELTFSLCGKCDIVLHNQPVLLNSKNLLLQEEKVKLCYNGAPGERFHQ